MSPRLLACAAALLLAALPVQAQMLHMLEARPAAQSVMSGQAQEFFVRFDGPVDHAASRLTIARGDAVIRTLRPRLGGQPNTLYAVSGSLPPGDYILRWEVTPPRGGRPNMGGLDFTVR